MKFARNEDCPCGSAKKFKKCCELKANPAITDEGLKNLSTLVDQELFQGIEAVTAEEHVEFNNMAMHQFKTVLNLDDDEFSAYLDTEFGQQQALEWLLFVSPYSESGPYMQSEPESEIGQSIGKTNLTLVVVDSAFSEFLVLKDLFNDEYHFIRLLQPRHLHAGDILSGRVLSRPEGKLLLSSYASFRISAGEKDELRRLMKRGAVAEQQPELFALFYQLARKQDFSLNPPHDHCHHH